MNDQKSRIELWQRLLEPSSLELLEETAGGDPREVSWLQGLRERWGGELAPAELAQAIHPSRYVRGSDVLDIFGQ